MAGLPEAQPEQPAQASKEVDIDDSQAEQKTNVILLDEKCLDPDSILQYGDDPGFRSRFQSPYTWSLTTKLRVLSGPFLASMLASYASSAYALASGALQETWGITDTQFNAGFTLYVFGFAFAPMVLAPASEVYGRYWVFLGSGVVLLAATLGCAVSRNLAGLLVSRFIVGNAAAVQVTVMGGVVADVYRKEDRNKPMAVYSLSIMVGTGLGPLVSGVVVEGLGWRWIFFLQAILIGTTGLLVALLFRETRTNVILKRYCRALNERESPSAVTRNVKFDIDHHGVTALQLDISILWRAYALPLRLLFTEPVVFWFSLWVAFAWGILYLTFGGLGMIFRSVYGFDSRQVGAVYTAIIVGSMIGALLISFQHVAVRFIRPRRDNARPTPEDRLLPPCVLSILLPIGLFWLGWTARTTIHWISPVLAVGCLTIGIFSIYTAVFNYLADSYQAYASSAMAAQSMCRNFVSGVFPLVVGAMIRNLTIKGAGSLLGGLGLILTVIPWLLYFWGRKIRARSPFANQAQDQEDW